MRFSSVTCTAVPRISTPPAPIMIGRDDEIVDVDRAGPAPAATGSRRTRRSVGDEADRPVDGFVAEVEVDVVHLDLAPPHPDEVAHRAAPLTPVLPDPRRRRREFRTLRSGDRGHREGRRAITRAVFPRPAAIPPTRLRARVHRRDLALGRGLDHAAEPSALRARCVITSARVHPGSRDGAAACSSVRSSIDRRTPAVAVRIWSISVGVGTPRA